jgi:hypothetical protein
MDLKVKKIVSVLVSLMAIVPLYIFLHEGGHALTAVLCGARITEFSVLGAYMRYEGGVFTPGALSLFYVAGMGLPVLVSALYMLAYRSGTDGVFYRIFSFLFLLVPLGSVLGWAVAPVLCLLGQTPQGDDAAKFMESSGLSPWAVLLGAVALFAAILFAAWKKRIFQDYWAAVKRSA